jgi:hypothetical protein
VAPRQAKLKENRHFTSNFQPQPDFYFVILGADKHTLNPFFPARQSNVMCGRIRWLR